MTALTHKQFAISWVLIGNMILSMQDLSQINYYLSMIIMVQIAKYGALFPDIDCAWHSVKEKNGYTRVMNFLIRITGGKHRSWQTHSLDLALLMLLIAYWLPRHLYQYGVINSLNMEVSQIIMISFAIGWLSHLFSDMLNAEGVRVFCFLKFRLGLVPKQFMGIKFKTGEEWEKIVLRFTKILNVIIWFIALILPLICYQLTGKYIMEMNIDFSQFGNIF